MANLDNLGTHRTVIFQRLVPYAENRFFGTIGIAHYAVAVDDRTARNIGDRFGDPAARAGLRGCYCFARRRKLVDECFSQLPD